MLVVICAFGALGLDHQLINDNGELDTDSEWTVHYLNFDCELRQIVTVTLSSEQGLLFQLLRVQRFSYRYQ